jgi:RNA binding exosome subunit
MATDESHWITRAQDAESKLNTLQQQVERIKEDARSILETFSARKKGNGSFDINFEKFVSNIGQESAMEIRKIIDETYPNVLHLDKQQASG